MATVTITIPDAHLPRVVHALCTDAGLPESNANAKQAIIIHIKKTVRRVEKMEAEVDAIEAIPPPNVDDIAT